MPMDTDKSLESLARENEELRDRLKEAEEILQAIRLGEIDAVVVTGAKNDQIFMLEGADHAYRVMVEQMSESAGTLRTDGLVLFCNTNFFVLLESPAERVRGCFFQDFVSSNDQELFANLLEQAVNDRAKGEVELTAASGRQIPVLLSLSPLRQGGTSSLSMVVTDLSEQKQSEALRRTAKRLAEAQRVAQVGDWAWDSQTDTVTWSDQMFEILGLNLADPVPDYVGQLALYHPESAQRLSKAVTQALELGGGYELELRRTRPDGSQVDVLVRGLVEKDEQGRPNLLQGTVQDITDRKRAEEHIKASEREKLLILDSISDMVSFYDTTDLRILWANKASGDSVGVRPEDLAYRHCYEVWGGRTTPCPDCPVLVAFQRGKPCFAERETHDGRVWNLRAFPAFDEEGELKGVVEIGSEITEIKRAEKVQKAKDQRLHALLGDMDMVAVQGYDQERRVIYWNRASSRLYGYLEAEALGRNIEDLIIPISMRETTIRSIQGWVENGDPIPPGELQLMRKDGALISVYSSHVMLENSSGQKEMYCIDVDLTDIKQTHDQLLHAKKAAEKANMAKSEFLANMSHEIRTPLNGILGMLQLLLTTPVNDEQKLFVLQAVQSSRRLTRLLTDILDLSRVEAGKMEIAMSVFDFKDALDAVIQLFTQSANEKNLRMDCHINPNIPSRLKGDSARLQQVLSNLVGNAIKFTNNGHVAIEANPLPPRNKEEFRVLFTVADTGFGIPDDKLETLFKPFTQVCHGYRRDYQGAGLGLSICKRLVDLMGGNIAVESELGRGTTIYFCITFGLAPPSSEAISTDQLCSDLQGRLSILFAEDEPINRLATKRMVEKLGHRVVAVEDGQQALDALMEGDFDVILMDVQMPVMDGVEATKRIRVGEAGKARPASPSSP